MPLLASTSDKLQLVTSAAQAIDVQASWADFSSSSTTPGRTNSAITTATTTDVVASPASSTYRNIKQLTAFNKGSAPSDLTLKHTDGTTAVELFKATLNPNEALHYIEDDGFSVLDYSGRRKRRLAFMPPISAIGLTADLPSGEATTTRAATTGSAFAIYIGKAPADLTAVTILYRVTTLAATITWAEIALAVGTPNITAGLPRLQVVGFTDVSAVVNTTGIKSTAVSVNSALKVSEGDGLWAIYANQATTVAQLRALSNASIIGGAANETLFSLLQASFRPSSNIGNWTGFSQDSLLDPFWFAMKYS